MSDVNRLKKRRIRSAMLKKRDNLDSSAVMSAENCLFDALAGFLSGLKNRNGRPPAVMSYMSFRNEFPTHSFNEKIAELGMRLILPQTDAGFRLHARIAENPSHLALSPLGIPEPDPSVCPEVPVDEPDVIILPGVAFDVNGNRIGFGKGCYDRFLSGRKRPVTLIGAAYRFQISEEPLPAEPEDVPADLIVTEKGVIFCGPDKAF